MEGKKWFAISSLYTQGVTISMTLCDYIEICFFLDTFQNVVCSLTVILLLVRMHFLHTTCWVDSTMGSLTGQYDWMPIQYVLDLHGSSNFKSGVVLESEKWRRDYKFTFKMLVTLNYKKKLNILSDLKMKRTPSESWRTIPVCLT